MNGNKHDKDKFDAFYPWFWLYTVKYDNMQANNRFNLYLISFEPLNTSTQVLYKIRVQIFDYLWC